MPSASPQSDPLTITGCDVLRADNTATAQDGRWRWGNNERAAYVEVHNRLATSMAKALERIAPSYDAIYAYVAPSLTHRAFIVDREARRATGLECSRRVSGRLEPLIGVNDIVPRLVEVIPNVEALARLRRRLGGRLPAKLLSSAPALELLTEKIGATR